ncbi:MAG: hypothetical protein NVS3B21_16960 [Acidimicrobiales bacterium]
MPLTAQHPELGLLDATAENLRAGGELWPTIHRARPRVALRCRGCGHGLHAKVSPAALRYFAHDAAQSDCPTAGESMGHRLLKLELVFAARAAGWDAELEVAGEGWRADVLATSPNGRRVAWEAQLAAITTDEIKQRHATMTGTGLEVCWVADRNRPWIGHVPAIAVAQAPGDGATGLHVVAGAARFQEEWCGDRRRCDEVGHFSRYASAPGPCEGHGHWEPPLGLTLAAFVAAVCADTLRCHPLTAPHRDAYLGTGVPPAAWTAGRYVALEREQLEAADERDAWEARVETERAAHEKRIVELQERQQALRRPAARRVGELTGAQAFVNELGQGPEWAMGIPVEAGAHGVAAVICPVASRIQGRVRAALAPLLLFAATESEATRIRKQADPAQRIEVLTGDRTPPRSGSPRPARTAQSASRRMLGL